MRISKQITMTGVALAMITTTAMADSPALIAVKSGCTVILEKLVEPMVDAVLDGGLAECEADLVEPLADFEVACNAALDVETLGAGAIVCVAAGAGIASLCGVVTITGLTSGDISEHACDQIPSVD